MIQQSHLGIYLEKMKTLIQKDTCTPMFVAALLTTAKIWKQPRCKSTDNWLNKMCYIYTMEYYTAVKKNEILSFAATWIDLENIILIEVRQRKTTTNGITYIWNLKIIQLNLYIKQKQTYRHRKQTRSPKGRRRKEQIRSRGLTDTNCYI